MKKVRIKTSCELAEEKLSDQIEPKRRAEIVGVLNSLNISHSYPTYAAFEAGAEYQAPITREETIRELCELLRGDEAKIFAFSQYETHKCSANDAHITRQEWATWLESELNHGR